MKKILFHNEDVSFRLNDKKKIRDWIIQSILSEQKLPGEINFILCSDEFLLQMNRQFLQHDYYTDVITFDYTDGNTINGDVYISLDRVKENAAKEGIEITDEIKRILIHGTLHLIGYQDETRELRENMTKKENFFLIRFGH